MGCAKPQGLGIARSPSTFPSLDFREMAMNLLSIRRRMEREECFCYICLYMDGILYMGYSSHMLVEFKEEMKHTFEMTNLARLQYFLGLEVVQRNGYIHYS